MLRPLFASLALLSLVACKDTATSSPTPDPSRAAATSGRSAAELDPAKATEKAPDLFKARFETTKGAFVIEVHRDWSPTGADRFYNLVKMGFYDDTKFFRAVDGFMVQFGLSGTPEVNTAWRSARLSDDPVKESNKPGYVSFAMAGKNSRTTQIFINYGDNSRLDSMGFSPFGKVIDDGMDVVNKLYKGYGEGAPSGRGPNQGRIQAEGNAYLTRDFPQLDGVKKATIVP